MKIEIVKPKENIWKFPCLGKSKITSCVMYFYSKTEGIVVESDEYWPVGHTEASFDINKFEPVNPVAEPKPKPIDWDKAELPIWYKDTNGAIIKIDTIDKEFVCGFIIQEDASIRDFDHYYQTIDERNQSLSKIKFLPKGTKITIEL